MALSHSPSIVTNGLVLYLDAANRRSYPGSGTTWFDLSGNGNNGTLTNGPTFNAANGGGIVFDGVNDTASITDNSFLDFGTNSFTIMFSLYIPSTGIALNREYGIIDKNTSYENSAGWGIELSSWGSSNPFNTISIQFYNTGQTSWGNSNIQTTITTNIWNHIVIVRNSTTATLYNNGALVSQKTHSSIGLNVDNNSNIIIGKNSWGVNLNSNISQILLYNRALSPIEIAQNFNATRGRFGI